MSGEFPRVSPNNFFITSHGTVKAIIGIINNKTSFAFDSEGANFLRTRNIQIATKYKTIPSSFTHPQKANNSPEVKRSLQSKCLKYLYRKIEADKK